MRTWTKTFRSNMETLIITCSSIIAGLMAGTSFYIGYKTGFDAGRAYGRDEQFNDDFIAQGRKDAARRDRDGRFKRVEDKL